ncbi:MAG: FG-GAP repeat protein [Nitrosopumilus sp.]|nr:FG-GAP repeat protein [Nitrosopumilus sp.]MDH3487037.1 FG-GAP repeat protein [Nitrosopumilus sp.]
MKNKTLILPVLIIVFFVGTVMTSSMVFVSVPFAYADAIDVKNTSEEIFNVIAQNEINILPLIANPAPAVDDDFGRSVSISGDNVLVAAPGDDTEVRDAGAAYLFDATTGNLLQTFLNPTPPVRCEL